MRTPPDEENKFIWVILYTNRMRQVIYIGFGMGWYKVRRFKKRRSWKQSSKGYSGIARRALKMAKATRQMLNVEYKVFDTVVSEVSTNVAHIQGLSLLEQGDEVSNRNGDSVRAKGIAIRGAITHTAAGGNLQSVRIIVFQDNGQRGVIPAQADLLTSNSMFSLRNINGGSKRFRILWDKSWTVDDTSKERYIIHKYIKVNSEINYIATAGNQASQGIGNYYVYVQGELGANDATASLTFRLRYIDN